MLNRVIANYKILEKIGEGGMGEVYRGIDLMVERAVAIKVMRPELARRAEIVERFRKEAVVLAKLNHPNIATLYHFIRDDDSYFIVMEFAPGQALDGMLAKYANGLPWRRALGFFLQALYAIDHAHKEGIIHRDIKPANMMVSDTDRLKVLDFGIARMLGSARLTRTGATVGTLAYMSPEQIRGQEIDARSDLYSMGIVLYKMLTGRVPFTAEGQYELMRAQLEHSPSPVRRSIVEIPQSIDDAIQCSLAKTPAERFQSATEFIRALAPSLRGHASESRAGDRRSTARVAHVSLDSPLGPELLPTFVPVGEQAEIAQSGIAALPDAGEQAPHSPKHGAIPRPMEAKRPMPIANIDKPGIAEWLRAAGALDRDRFPVKSVVSTLVVVAVGALLAFTNPTLDSYQQYLRLSILKETKRQENPVAHALGTLLGGVASGVIASQTVRTDFVFWSTYETPLTDSERLRAVGLLKNFFLLENPAARSE